MSFTETLEGNDYHLEQGVKDEQASSSEEASKRRTLKYALVGAVIFGCLTLGLVVHMATRPRQADSIYTVNNSKYGIPEECEEFTAFCAEKITTGSVSCTCGDYLYLWSEDDAAWVEASSRCNDDIYDGA